MQNPQGSEVFTQTYETKMKMLYEVCMSWGGKYKIAHIMQSLRLRNLFHYIQVQVALKETREALSQDNGDTSETQVRFRGHGWLLIDGRGCG